MRATRSNSSLSPIFRGPRYRRKWSKTREIFFHDRPIISNRFSCLPIFLPLFPSLDRFDSPLLSPFALAKDSAQSLGRNLPPNFFARRTTRIGSGRRRKGTREDVVSFDGRSNEADRLRRSPKSRRTFFAPLPVAKLITFSDVRWTAISYRRGIATYRPLSLARTSRILFLGCGFARYTLLGNWTWSGHAGSALAAHLLPLLYLWVAKFTKRCGSELRMPAGATTRPRSTTSFDVTRFKTERRIGTSPAYLLPPAY